MKDNLCIHCKFDKHVKSKRGKANKSLYVIGSLQKEGCSQLAVDYSFYPMLPTH